MAESEEDRAVRERLVTRGAGRLSDVELVSIVIRERIKTEPAIDTARRLLAGVDGSLTRLAGLSFRELRSSCGLGATRAAMLQAALELGRRLRFEGVSEVSRIEGTQDVVRMFRPLVTGLSHEEFWVLYLTAGYTGVRLGVTPWSVLCASAAGVPGVALMVLMRLIWLI